MICLSWNCQGLGSPSTVPNLKYIKRTYKPDVIILFETMSNANKLEDLKYVLSFGYFSMLIEMEEGVGYSYVVEKTLNCKITNYS